MLYNSSQFFFTAEITFHQQQISSICPTQPKIEPGQELDFLHEVYKRATAATDKRQCDSKKGYDDTDLYHSGCQK